MALLTSTSTWCDTATIVPTERRFFFIGKVLSFTGAMVT
jgi:hypothetical protein